MSFLLWASFIGIAINIWRDTHGTGGPGGIGILDAQGHFILDAQNNFILDAQNQ